MSEIFLFKGFTKDEIEAGKSALVEKGKDLQDLIFVPAGSAMMEANVEELLTKIDGEGSHKANDLPLYQLKEGESKVVIMAVGSQDKAISVMRAYKSILEDPTQAAFAMVTESSLTWTLGYYMDHVSKEHEYMKTHNPATDPDMKKIN